MRRNLVFLGLVIFGLSACKQDVFDQFSVVYEVEFVSTWSASTHPSDFPANAHFSPFVVCSHLSSAQLFLPGLVASEGVQDLAETGATAKINDEIQKWINTSISVSKAEANSFDSPGNSNKVQLGVRSGYGTVTAISMIAPSPDWFVAATTTLQDPIDGLWYNQVISHAIAYDAGTDSGTNFTAADLATNPAAGVAYIISGPLTEGTDSVVNMGYFKFTRIQ